jgi:hypothetical protein
MRELTHQRMVTHFQHVHNARDQSPGQRAPVAGGTRRLPLRPFIICHSCSQTPFPDAGYGREPDERRLVMNIDRLYYGLAGVGIPPLLALLPSHVYTKQYAYMHTKIRTHQNTKEIYLYKTE